MRGSTNVSANAGTGGSVIGLKGIGGHGKRVYSGGADSIPATRTDDLARATPYVRDALVALAAGRPIANAVTRPYGCVVKYRPQA